MRPIGSAFWPCGRAAISASTESSRFRMAPAGRHLGERQQDESSLLRFADGAGRDPARPPPVRHNRGYRGRGCAPRCGCRAAGRTQLDLSHQREQLGRAEARRDRGNAVHEPGLVRHRHRRRAPPARARQRPARPARPARQAPLRASLAAARPRLADWRPGPRGSSAPASLRRLRSRSRPNRRSVEYLFDRAACRSTLAHRCI